MVAEIKSGLIRVIILDISGIYAQIHNEGYYEPDQLVGVYEQYYDSKRWRVLVIREQQ